MGWCFQCFGSSKEQPFKNVYKFYSDESKPLNSNLYEKELPVSPTAEISADESKSCKSNLYERELPVAPTAEISADESKSLQSNLYEKELPVAPTFEISAEFIAFQELLDATKNFSSECFLGEGGFGRVYKGQIKSTGQVVAVKQLDTDGIQGDREFLVECLIFNLVLHPNLVNLIGYSAKGNQRLLVYEYMPFGSLEDHLHDLPPNKQPLDWNTRMKIAAGAARGLEFLHDKANPPVIYRDLKSANILLGEGFQAKLSDFGLAKLGPAGDKTHVSTRVMGTYGYCAPEYAQTGKLTCRSDIYSFGVVLLEILTGRKAIDPTRTEQSLVAWARPRFRDKKKFRRMADPLLQGRYPVRAFYQALTVAGMCIQENATSRPLIKEVANALTYLASHLDECNAGSDISSRSDSSDSARSDLIQFETIPGFDKCKLTNFYEQERKRAVVEAKVWSRG